ncbi:glycosyltransferase, group 2 family protein [Candidatus Symbiothrix dinenymphae]|nr:glycosyltransferase, group 2 family protein [Candidatus Symbiothrix dinenymphae]
MEQMTTISLIIPVYNVEKYLAECLDSVVAQTFTNWEAICVNDGSTDKSAEILAQYAAADPRIKIVAQQNAGVSVARNNALSHACGEFIYFLDADDWIHPQLLEITYHFATKHRADWVAFKYDKKLHRKQRRTPSATNTNEPHPPFKLYENIDRIPYNITDDPLFSHFESRRSSPKFYVQGMALWQKLYRKTLLDGHQFLPNISLCEDSEFTMALYAQKSKLVLLNVPLYFYRYNPHSAVNSMQTQVLKATKDTIVAIKSIISNYKDASIDRKNHLAKEIIFPLLVNQLRYPWRMKNAEALDLLSAELRFIKANGLLQFNRKFTLELINRVKWWFRIHKFI